MTYQGNIIKLSSDLFNSIVMYYVILVKLKFTRIASPLWFWMRVDQKKICIRFGKLKRKSSYFVVVFTLGGLEEGPRHCANSCTLLLVCWLTLSMQDITWDHSFFKFPPDHFLQLFKSWASSIQSSMVNALNSLVGLHTIDTDSRKRYIHVPVCLHKFQFVLSFFHFTSKFPSAS